MNDFALRPLCPHCQKRPISSERPIAGKPRRTCGRKRCIEKQCEVARQKWKRNRSPERVAEDREKAREWTRLYREDYELYSSPRFKAIKAKSKKKMYEIRKAAGICPACKKAPAAEGRVKCAACQAVETARIKKYRQTDGYFQWMSRDAEKERANGS